MLPVETRSDVLNMIDSIEIYASKLLIHSKIENRHFPSGWKPSRDSKLLSEPSPYDYC